MSWKVALYDFVHNRNQMEVDYGWEALASVVSDGLYLEKERARQERRKARDRYRRLQPLKAETRLRLRDVNQGEDAVTADVELRKTVEITVNGKPHREETLQLERVRLERRGAGYQVIEAEPLAREALRHPDAARFSYNPAELDTLQRIAGVSSAPFLNRELVRNNATRDFELPRQIPYNRELVRQYADRWWNDYNPEFLHFDVDCSNYVSQCLFAGGAPMNYTGKRETGWWYRGRSGSQELWSFSWAVANALKVHLANSRTGLRAEQVESPTQLAIGDVISYDWEGDGSFGHSTVVTGFDGNGMPLVNAHTVNSRNRFWDYRDSYAWTERTMYRFFHIADSF